MKNFPGKKRAIVVGVLKAGFTLGSVLIVAVYSALFDGTVASFMLMLAIATGGTQLIGKIIISSYHILQSYSQMSCIPTT